MNRFSTYRLSEDIMRALDALGYIEPTDVQQLALPDALAGRDLLIQAKTGSGKTASFGIPIAESIRWEENRPQALVLVPTRELAVQVAEEIGLIGRFKRLRALAVFGKSPIRLQRTALHQKTHAIVGTPGRVLDLLERGDFNPSAIQTVVLDEADEMLRMGFSDQVGAILQAMPNERATWLFSATFPEAARALAAAYLREPVRLATGDSGGDADLPAIAHERIAVAQEDKLAVLKRLTAVENPDSCLIFCNTKDRVDEVAAALDRAGYPVDKLHGGMEQDDRLAVIDDFRRGRFRYLIATDVAARGIDVEGIPLVVHYDLPPEKEAYIHRTGRTGRAGASGRSIGFVTARDAQALAAIEAHAGIRLRERPAPTQEEAQANRDAFRRKMAYEPPEREKKGAVVNEGILKLYFNGGKKKKLRAVDFVGAIARLPGVEASDIGIITILDAATYVEILNGKGWDVLRQMRETPVKGKLLKVHEARK